jgi:hypothetical protein
MYAEKKRALRSNEEATKQSIIARRYLQDVEPALQRKQQRIHQEHWIRVRFLLPVHTKTFEGADDSGRCVSGIEANDIQEALLGDLPDP